MVELASRSAAPDFPPTDPLPASAAGAAPGRFRSFRDERRRVHRTRVHRIEIPGALPAPEVGVHTGPLETAGTLRDVVVRAMLRRNQHQGATRFHVVLSEPPRDPVDPTWRADLGAALALRPVVGLICRTPVAQVTVKLLDALAEAAGDKEIWLEMAAHPPGGAAEFAAAAHAARNRSIPVIATLLLGVPGETPGTHARRLNEIRVRAVRIHPFHESAPDAGCGGTEHSGTFPDRGAYLAALADLVERLEPSIELAGLGAGVPPARVRAPAWLREAADYHELLEHELARRGSRQGRRLDG
ncbi:MAG: hypothetical protein JXQ29_14720 [Planctomycetes bacterium]|nr:hypothetical protein [Planctomycetota bacterium]